MAWENQIVGYKIQHYEKESIIPPDAVFLMKETKSVCFSLQRHYYDVYIYQIPIYKKVRTKKKAI
jgi:hypothetical protein